MIGTCKFIKCPCHTHPVLSSVLHDDWFHSFYHCDHLGGQEVAAAFPLPSRKTLCRYAPFDPTFGWCTRSECIPICHTKENRRKKGGKRADVFKARCGLRQPSSLSLSLSGCVCMVGILTRLNNPAYGQLNRGNFFPLFSFAPERVIGLARKKLPSSPVSARSFSTEAKGFRIMKALLHHYNAVSKSTLIMRRNCWLPLTRGHQLVGTRSNVVSINTCTITGLLGVFKHGGVCLTNSALWIQWFGVTLLILS